MAIGDAAVKSSASSLCLCKCGQEVAAGRRYVRGHNTRVLWTTQKYRSFHSTKMKRQWSCSAYRKLMILLRSKEWEKRWRDPAYRRRVSLCASKRMTSLWTDPEYRRKMSVINSAAMKKQWRNPLYRIKAVADFKSVWKNKAFRARRMKIMRSLPWRKARSDDMIHRLMMSKGAFSSTKIEKAVQKLLDDLGIKYSEHPRVLNYVPDLLISKSKTGSVIVEVDGCYYHDCPICKKGERENRAKRRTYARKRDTDLKNAGYRVIHIRQHELKDEAAVRTRLQQELFGKDLGQVP